MFQDKIVVITGGVQGIGKCIADEFLKEGAMVCVIDKQPGGYFTGDLADERTLSAFADKVISKYGHVDYLINNALPLMKGIDTVHMMNLIMLCVSVSLHRFILLNYLHLIFRRELQSLTFPQPEIA